MEYRFAPIDSILAIDAEDFAALVPPGDPFVSQAFLGALERHGATAPHLGWMPQHIVAHDHDGRVAGLLPLYLKTNSFGEFIHDWHWASVWERAGLAYYPKLFTGLPYTPAGGSRLWLRAGADRALLRHGLIGAAIELAREHGLSSWHVAFPAADEVADFRAAHLLQRHDVQYHWLRRDCRDFDAYLACFTAEKRRKVRAERRKVAAAGIAIEEIAGDAITPELWHDIHALYASTFDKYGNYPALSAACLAEIGTGLGKGMLVFLARRGGAAIATSICFRDADTLYGRYWGTAERIDGLHFELCYYQGIDYCLRHGLSRFEPGAGGEHKIARGFEPTLVTTLHWIADTGMRESLRRYLAQHAQAVERYADEAGKHLPFHK